MAINTMAKNNIKSLISITDFSKEEITDVLDLAGDFKTEYNTKHRHMTKSLADTIIALLFFEPSTRTHNSFGAAAQRLGAQTREMSGTDGTSVAKGESFHDTIMTFAQYVDLIVMRNPWDGSARYAAELQNEVPVINAGDGANQHPTQTLLDLFSIRETQGGLDGLHIMMVGDLKYGRTVHSLVHAMSEYKTTFTFVSPPELKLPGEYKSILSDKGLEFFEETDLAANMARADIIYATRIQRERFPDIMEYEKVKNAYVITNDTLGESKETARLLHPLPRVNEIAPEVDENPKAYYFRQAQNGMFVRMALMTRLVNGKQG